MHTGHMCRTHTQKHPFIQSLMLSAAAVLLHFISSIQTGNLLWISVWSVPFWPIWTRPKHRKASASVNKWAFPKKRKTSCQVGFLISPCFVTWLVLQGALEAGIQPTQGTEIGLLEGGEKWCKITRGNIRPNLEGGREREKKKKKKKKFLMNQGGHPLQEGFGANWS